MKTIIILSLTLLVSSCATTEVKTESVDTTKVVVDTAAVADTAMHAVIDTTKK